MQLLPMMAALHWLKHYKVSVGICGSRWSIFKLQSGGRCKFHFKPGTGPAKRILKFKENMECSKSLFFCNHKTIAWVHTGSRSRSRGVHPGIVGLIVFALPVSYWIILVIYRLFYAREKSKDNKSPLPKYENSQNPDEPVYKDRVTELHNLRKRMARSRQQVHSDDAE